MNEKEIAEIRRRFKAEKSNISRIRGCYINENREIISEFNESLGLMSTEEAEELLSVLKKTLSGTVGKNLIDIEFSAQQVLDSEQHKLLSTLRSTELADDDAIKTLYETIIGSVKIEGSYLILLAGDKYDVPSFSKDGEKADNADVFSYFLCCICPVKQTKASLGYHAYENKFCNIGADTLVAAPVLGFLFPTFDDRTANIYKTLYYTRSTSESQTELVDALFGCELPLPAEEQKETFQSVLLDAVSEDCSLEVVKNVHEELSEIIRENKERKEEEPPAVSRETVKEVLEASGISETQLKAFEEHYESEFGADTVLNPQNLIDSKRFEIQTPDVSIKVNPERYDLVETRIIDGVKYILVRAGDDVEVNGIRISIKE